MSGLEIEERDGDDGMMNEVIVPYGVHRLLSQEGYLMNRDMVLLTVHASVSSSLFLFPHAEGVDSTRHVSHHIIVYVHDNHHHSWLG